MKRLLSNNVKQKIAMECVGNGIGVFSPHTSLDNCLDGINDWLASGLGDGKTSPITLHGNPPKGQEGCGSGRMHELDSPVFLDVLVGRIKMHLGLKHVRVARANEILIKRVAICAGSGSSVLANVPADLYLTGEMGHHDCLAAIEQNTNVVLCEVSLS